jgi:hypothetical protein
MVLKVFSHMISELQAVTFNILTSKLVEIIPSGLLTQNVKHKDSY